MNAPPLDLPEKVDPKIARFMKNMNRLAGWALHMHAKVSDYRYKSIFFYHRIVVTLCRDGRRFVGRLTMESFGQPLDADVRELLREKEGDREAIAFNFREEILRSYPYELDPRAIAVIYTRKHFLQIEPRKRYL